MLRSVDRPGGGGAPSEVELAGGRLRLWTGFFGAAEADRLFDELWAGVAWERHHVRIAGRRMPSPRLSAWYGVPGARYRYSGVTYEPLPLLPALESVRRRLEECLGARFNSVLANAYRTGADSMGWHSDDESELGPRPVIASVSLGAVRRFRLKHRDRGIAPVAFDLPHGSLLVMDGDTQSHWRHAVPKTRRPVGLRLNLTFREIEIGESSRS